MTITGIHHIALTVSDADKSFAFYEELLGLEEVLRIEDETVLARIMGGDGFLFAVRHYKQHATDRFSEFRTGLDHFAFGVADQATLEAYEQRLEQMGATYTPVAESPVGPVVVFRDPDGIQGEIFLPTV